MQQGKPIILEDAVVFLDRASKQKTINFRWINHDIFTEIDVYLVRNNKSKKLVDGATSLGQPPVFSPNVISYLDSLGNPVILRGRFVAIPNTTYNVSYTFTWQEHFRDFHKKYPIFKFRIEMVGNPNIFAESNEFKIVY